MAERVLDESSLTDRQRREQQYYNEFVRRTHPDVASLAAIRGEERRPWNPYWYVADLALAHFKGPQQRLLDFGCGPGTYAVQFAHIGYEVFGFDIAPANVEAAEQLAAKYGLSNRTHFSVGVAEQLNYPSAHFDLITGIDILHHVEIAPAIAECMRVLKPGGVAIFKEPIEAPIFDRLRNTALGRALRPKEVSFERHLTEDERKLTADDLRLLHRMCAVEEQRFRLISRLETFLGSRAYTRSGASRLEMLDRRVLQLVPPLRPFTGYVVLQCRHR